ncbi:hypothetical protein SynBIOSE41_03082 [Synechococcus sp. BIOS-E4-1]|nr:hypothetical protein SynBIOSE41_03082 [Synechococcus sp. BIOS-E4-1]
MPSTASQQLLYVIRSARVGPLVVTDDLGLCFCFIDRISCYFQLSSV